MSTLPSLPLLLDAAPAGRASVPPRGRDPLAKVASLGQREARSRFTVGLAAALLVHAGGTAWAAQSLADLQSIARAMRTAIQEELRATYEVDAEKPPEPAPEPEPEPEEPPPDPVVVPPPPPPEEDPYDTPEKKPEPEDPYEPPPAPAEAAKVLTDDSPDATGPAIVSGDGQGPGFGMVSAAGIGDRPTFRRNAQVGGVPGARGTGPVRPPPKKDLSRPADLMGARAWDCPFPTEADASGIDGGVVALVITVRADGRAQGVRVTQDPGHGFGRVAHQCALKHVYRPARDADGKAIASTLGPIRIRFIR